VSLSPSISSRLSPPQGRGAVEVALPGASPPWSRVVGEAEVMRLLEQAIVRVGAFDCPVLVTGETGCGKEEVARAIHATGSRGSRSFVAVNCGAIVSTLAESQLFGHARGSFTGADASTAGAFRAADGGILFLDEIGEMPLDLQPKLLRALQQREVTPVGATRPIPVDVQVIAATNRDLAVEVAAGRFREDLFYRLNVIHLTIPPLRARRDDIPRFVEHFTRHFASIYGLPVWQPDAAMLSRFVDFAWPGNIRQLSQTIQRVAIFADQVEAILDETFAAPIPAPGMPEVVPEAPLPPSRDNPAAVGPGQAPDTSVAAGPEALLPVFHLDELRRLAVRQALAAAEGHRGRAARLLGVSPNTMTKLVAEACPGEQAALGRPSKARGATRAKPR
jgi:DNA-binding NtrC family response regulator